VVPDPKTGKVPHPKTKELIAPDTVFTLPNGKQIKIGEYYRQLNELERRLNQAGHSLKETPSKRMTLQPGVKPGRRLPAAGPVTPNPAEANRVKALLTPQAAFQVQRSEQAQKSAQAQKAQQARKSAAASPPRAAAIGPAVGEIRPVNPPGSGSAPPGPISDRASGAHIADPLAFTQRYRTSKPWPGWVEGDPSTFQVNIGGGRIDLEAVRKGDLESDPRVISTTNVHADASFSATVLNNSFDILRVTGDAHAPDSQPADIRLDLYVLGAQVYEVNKQGNGIQDSVREPWNFSPKPYSGSYQIGPFMLSAQVGVNGEVGFTLNYGLFPTNAYADIDPYVHTSGYVSASVGVGLDGIDLVSVGVRANLTFLNEDVTLGGKAALLFDPGTGLPYFDFLYYGNDCWHYLDGSVTLFVQWASPCWFPWAQCGCNLLDAFNNWCSNELDDTIANWSGDQGCYTIFGGEDKINLPIGQ
jgi:hypothetical protein